MDFLFIHYISQTFLNVDHHQTTGVNYYLIAHQLIVSGINFFTVGIEYIADSQHRQYGDLFIFVGLLTFYVCVYLTTLYNQAKYRLTVRKIIGSSVALVLGCIVINQYYQHLWVTAICLLVITAGIGIIVFL